MSQYGVFKSIPGIVFLSLCVHLSPIKKSRFTLDRLFFSISPPCFFRVFPVLPHCHLPLHFCILLEILLGSQELRDPVMLDVDDVAVI